jgi:hypothetical protein
MGFRGDESEFIVALIEVLRLVRVRKKEEDSLV